MIEMLTTKLRDKCDNGFYLISNYASFPTYFTDVQKYLNNGYQRVMWKIKKS